MSKKLGQAAIKGVVRDFFVDSDPGGFKLSPPENFDLFNSFRTLDQDTFAGVNVFLFESVLWKQDDRDVTSIKIGDEKFYSGSHDGPLPEGISLGTKSQYLIVASYSLNKSDPHITNIRRELTDRGCELQDQLDELVFMFLRGSEALAFNTTLAKAAEENISHQAEESNYQSTDVKELLPYYEKFIVFNVNQNSALAGKSVFWFSYIIAAHWKGAAARHVTATALYQISTVYDNNLWHFPIDNARLAIVATHFKHTYIDLYRCIEWLYVLPRCMMVKAELNLQQKASKLAKTLSEKLAWRRTEKDSLELLLLASGLDNLDSKLVNDCLLSELQPIPPHGPMLQKPGVQTGENQIPTLDDWRKYAAKALASRLYAVRNQFVHQLDVDDEQEVRKGSEAAFVTLLSELIAILYLKYAAEF